MERKVGDHSGHRQRLLQKLEQEDLTDYETLEVLLFYVFKRRNTNDLAHRLLAEFGSLKKLFQADVDELQRVEGIGKQAAQFLYVLGKTHRVQAENKSIRTAVWKDYDTEKFVESIRPYYVGMQSETLDFYLLDVDGNVYLRRRFSGDKYHVALEPTTFTRMILDNHPSGIIAVHNHPSGNCIPSSYDEKMTRECQLVCSFHNVLFCDHLILSDKESYSYYQTGEMQKLSETYSMKNFEKARKDTVYQDDRRCYIPNVFQKDLDKVTIERRGGRYVGIIKE